MAGFEVTAEVNGRLGLDVRWKSASQAKYTDS
jgi:hypothetical protein